MYLEFLNDLQRNLLRVVNQYSDWYTLKPNSLLKEYLDKNNIYISTYFCPSDLIDVVKRIIDFPFFNPQNNSKLVTVEPELQPIFEQWIIYEPNIWTHLLPHIYKVPILKSIPLQNERVKQNLSIRTPDELIYQNVSSQFWLHPNVNNVLTKNKQLTHTWNNLLPSFIKLCTSDNEYFTRQDELVRVNPNTSLSSLFTFNCFHVDQCESILRQLTKFVGKYDCLANICSNLQTEFIFYDVLTNENSLYKNVFAFIEDTINNNTHLFSEINL